LIVALSISGEIENSMYYNALLSDCRFSAVQKILTKARQLVDVKKDDGFAALHLAALNGHLRTAETLIDIVRLCSLLTYLLSFASDSAFADHCARL